MRADAIARELFAGEVSSAWVLRHAPHRLKLGHSTVLFYRQDIEQWIESLRDQS